MSKPHFIISPPPKNKIKGLPGCWTIYLMKDSTAQPYAYIRKPKNIDQAKFDKFMKSIVMHAPLSAEGF